jgi:hypothetical protein
MLTTAPPNAHYSATAPVLFVACELREQTWQRGCTIGHGPKPRERTVPARPHARLLDDIAQAQRRVGLPDTAPVVSCSEAGRAGVWRQRF